MVRFLVKITRKPGAAVVPVQVTRAIPGKNAPDGLYIEAEKVHVLTNGPERYHVFGDVINAPVDGQLKSIRDICMQTRGTFYVIKTDATDGAVEVAGSIFGIFPVYYAESGDKIIISSDIGLVAGQLSDPPTLSKRFILEKMLFYYPLFDRTVFNEIRTVPAQTVIRATDRSVSFSEYFDFTAYFRSDPLPYRKHTGVLSDHFIETARQYFPDEPFFITFTGGFDGRTLVSCALADRRQFRTFSLGDHHSDDVVIPAANAKEAGIDYFPVYLDTREYAESFLADGKAVLMGSGLMNNLLYTHFNYAARKIAGETRYVLTGFGGSEIFRALDIRGAVTSHELVDFFEFSRNSEWIPRILHSRKLRTLSRENFKEELEELVEDLKRYQSGLDQSAGLNERIYIYLYNEVFRKVFGPSIRAMSDHVIVRNPYFDAGFNIELLKYSIAGLYSKFLVKNPVKRLKGQVLYGHIINKTSPLLAGQRTGKGYRPADLTSYAGLFNITLNYIKKHSVNKVLPANLDNLGLLSGFGENRVLITALLKEDPWFDPSCFDQLIGSGSYKTSLYDRDLLLLTASVLLFKNFYYEENISSH